MGKFLPNNSPYIIAYNIDFRKGHQKIFTNEIRPKKAKAPLPFPQNGGKEALLLHARKGRRAFCHVALFKRYDDRDKSERIVLVIVVGAVVVRNGLGNGDDVIRTELQQPRIRLFVRHLHSTIPRFPYKHSSLILHNKFNIKPFARQEGVPLFVHINKTDAVVLFIFTQSDYSLISLARRTPPMACNSATTSSPTTVESSSIV